MLLSLQHAGLLFISSAPSSSFCAKSSQVKSRIRRFASRQTYPYSSHSKPHWRCCSLYRPIEPSRQAQRYRLRRRNSRTRLWCQLMRRWRRLLWLRVRRRARWCLRQPVQHLVSIRSRLRDSCSSNVQEARRKSTNLTLSFPAATTTTTPAFVNAAIALFSAVLLLPPILMFRTALPARRLAVAFVATKFSPWITPEFVPAPSASRTLTATIDTAFETP